MKKKSLGRNSSLKKTVGKKSPSTAKRLVSKKSPAKIRSLSPKKTLQKIGAIPPEEIEPISYAVPGALIETQELKELPYSYNKTQLVLLARDPFWAYTYWDFSGETWNWIVSMREKDHDTKPKLRIHNIDNGNSYDRDVSLEAKNWYLDLGLPDTTFEVELGLLDSRGKFHRIALSNRIRTPRNGPSLKIDQQWEISEMEFAEIYRLSGGGKAGHGSETFSSFRRP